MRRLSALPVIGLALALGGCWDYANVPPNYIGLMQTPTGYDSKIYSPGQVDIGTESTTNYGNRLVLIQSSGFAVKEQFLRNDPENPRDPEDHRCVVGPRQEPMSLDTRLLLALPDYTTTEGKNDLMRIAVLGNPRPFHDASRTLELTAASVYAEQAQLQVRGKIRQICAGYESVEAVFKALPDDGENGFSKKIRKAVAAALVESKVPLHLVDAVVSNVKPDPTVMDAIAAKQAAEKRVEAIKVVTDFLGNDPDGTKKLVYKLQAMGEMMKAADEKGRSMIFMTDVGSGPAVLPVPQR